jgi:hypothetical protein
MSFGWSASVCRTSRLGKSLQTQSELFGRESFRNDVRRVCRGETESHMSFEKLRKYERGEMERKHSRRAVLSASLQGQETPTFQTLFGARW